MEKFGSARQATVGLYRCETGSLALRKIRLRIFINRVARNGVYLCLEGGKHQARYNCVRKK